MSRKSHDPLPQFSIADTVRALTPTAAAPDAARNIGPGPYAAAAVREANEARRREMEAVRGVTAPLAALGREVDVIRPSALVAYDAAGDGNARRAAVEASAARPLQMEEKMKARLDAMFPEPVPAPT